MTTIIDWYYLSNSGLSDLFYRSWLLQGPDEAVSILFSKQLCNAFYVPDAKCSTNVHSILRNCIRLVVLLYPFADEKAKA